MDTLGGLLTWLGFGLVAGLVGRTLLPGRQAMGWLATISLGIAGSFAGGFLHSLVRGGDLLQPSGLLMSIVGAVLVLAVALSLERERKV
jgi:uncharacterized membrane protein YeaQ/YmgE (transglycosylase-associated protein family)